MRKLNVLDLFSGAGGLSRGFYDAGYDVVLGVDFDEIALKTFSVNHGNSATMKLDLFDHKNIDNIESFLNEKNVGIDVLIGGPPCQGFSIAGPRNEDDKRNTLYLAMVKVAERLRPKAIVLENVPGLLQLKNGIAAESIIRDFESLGYKMSAKILYAPYYGVPQIRKRVFFVGILDSQVDFNFPKPVLEPREFITCEEAINDLPALEGEYGDDIQNYLIEPQSEYQLRMRRNSAKIHNHIGTIHSEKTLKFLSLIPEGKNYKALPKQFEGVYKYHEALTRYNGKKPSLTINTGHRSHFHYRWNRIPTVRESARLQSFPDDFVFFGNKSQQYRQVGNAVPPLLGYYVALKLKEYFESEH